MTEPTPRPGSIVGKAASDVAVHRIHKFPEFEPQESPHQVDHIVDVIHKPRESINVASATNTVTSEKDPIDEPRQSKKKSWPATKRRLHRKHLKPEPLHFREYIPYDVEFPQRVTAQLQRIIGRTQVRLNDRAFVANVQDKITKEEQAEMEKKAHRRAKSEFDRVKKLVVSGLADGTTIPTELEALKAHPAFMVKQMLDRLDTIYDTTTSFAVKPHTKILAVEPYEYNGDKFFKNLHTNGDMDWVPKRVRRERREQSKNPGEQNSAKPSNKQLQKEKLRVLYKRPSSISHKESTADMFVGEDQTAKNINKQQSLKPGEIVASGVSDKHDFPNSSILKLFLQQQIIADALERKNRLKERKRQEVAKLAKYEEQWKQRTKRCQNVGTSQGQTQVTSLDTRPMLPDGPSTSFDRLRKAFEIGGVIDPFQHTTPGESRLLKYIDEADDVDELFGNAAALNRLYVREANFVNKFIPTLQLLSFHR